MNHYVNENLCFNQNELLNLNIFDQYFLLDVSELIQSAGAARQPAAIDKMTLLENNDLLSLSSDLMRTNLKFGPVVKQISRNQNKGQSPTRPAAAAAPSPASPPAGAMGPARGGTGGSRGGGY